AYSVLCKCIGVAQQKRVYCLLIIYQIISFKYGEWSKEKIKMQTTRSRTSEDKSKRRSSNRDDAQSATQTVRSRSKEDTRCLRLQVGPNSVSLGGGELETRCLSIAELKKNAFNSRVLTNEKLKIAASDY
ncbi:hypothetical protein T4E_7222, partial [Trichinella pseudospiralis]